MWYRKAMLTLKRMEYFGCTKDYNDYVLQLSTQPKKNSKEILVDLQTNKGETSTDLGRIQFSHAMRVEAVLPNAGENIVSKVYLSYIQL